MQNLIMTTNYIFLFYYYTKYIYIEETREFKFQLFFLLVNIYDPFGQQSACVHEFLYCYMYAIAGIVFYFIKREKCLRFHLTRILILFLLLFLRLYKYTFIYT